MSDMGCEVCGGHVRPLDAQSVFGYCENCGIVYALKDRLKVAWDTQTHGVAEAGTDSRSKGTNIPMRLSTVDVPTPAQSSVSFWRCPDCDAEFRFDNDSDLEFAKREHIREYHPNRSTE